MRHNFPVSLWLFKVCEEEAFICKCLHEIFCTQVPLNIKQVDVRVHENVGIMFEITYVMQEIFKVSEKFIYLLGRGETINWGWWAINTAGYMVMSGVVMLASDLDGEGLKKFVFKWG